MASIRGISTKGICISLVVAGALFSFPIGIQDDQPTPLLQQAMIEDTTPPDNDITTRIISFPILTPAEPEKAQIKPEIRYIEIEATAYCLKGTMYNGEYVHKGAISVDPKVIPLGTKGYIEGIGEVIAQDTGGAIKGNKVDIWMPTYEEAMKFGRQKLKLRIYD